MKAPRLVIALGNHNNQTEDETLLPQLDANNEAVVMQHVMCAAAELALTPNSSSMDNQLFGPQLQCVIPMLKSQGLLGCHPRSLGSHGRETASNSLPLYYKGVSENVARGISLRTIDPEQFDILDETSGKVLERIEGRKAFYHVYGETIGILPTRVAVL